MVNHPAEPCPSDLAALTACQLRYASDSAIAQYCDAHFGPDKFGVENFPARMARICCEAMAGRPRHRALDLGCAVGRASFELAARFEQVTGIDFSRPFIDTARRLQERGTLCYQLTEEGEFLAERKVSLQELGLAHAAARVFFHQGDARHLQPHQTGYDLILAANLIDRLGDPAGFLAGIHQRLVPGGLLVIASPYTWLEEFTPRRNWLGGRYRCGVPLTSLAGLGEHLEQRFTMIQPPQEVESVLRETARKFQVNISQVTIWRRDH
ncbi:hypothetical protein JCM30471_30890 [Desulfuromonas carbonis]|uniref:putative 4-mercaptohistidine N1-methyltransferase n=1 Tax=Desulfuromonas sp. DDH964 TaxID=1823759 RepID=UPI00078C717D|nr:putative 4-mercaptohistidine N1-methyltransferase [Desulfuromonas sp. DDH964]AMV71250.1 SAM-dependent methyltransferase [Desulfuromonas sp. DDH964]